MKTLTILLFGLASSLLPFKCAKAENTKNPNQHVQEKISQHLYYTSEAEQLNGKIVIEFMVDSVGKISIQDEQANNEAFKNFVHEKLAEITFDDPQSLKGERFIIRINTEK
jgi:hypothetical protein